MTDDIVSFAAGKGFKPKKPPLSEVLSDAQIEQVKDARQQGIGWTAIVRYFKEVHEIDYSQETYRKLFS